MGHKLDSGIFIKQNEKRSNLNSLYCLISDFLWYKCALFLRKGKVLFEDYNNSNVTFVVLKVISIC